MIAWQGYTMHDPFLVHKAFKRRKAEKQNIINVMSYIRLHNHGINDKIQNPFVLILKVISKIMKGS